MNKKIILPSISLAIIILIIMMLFAFEFTLTYKIISFVICGLLVLCNVLKLIKSK